MFIQHTTKCAKCRNFEICDNEYANISSSCPGCKLSRSSGRACCYNHELSSDAFKQFIENEIQNLVLQYITNPTKKRMHAHGVPVVCSNVCENCHNGSCFIAKRATINISLGIMPPKRPLMPNYTTQNKRAKIPEPNIVEPINTSELTGSDIPRPRAVLLKDIITQSARPMQTLPQIPGPNIEKQITTAPISNTQDKSKQITKTESPGPALALVTQLVNPINLTKNILPEQKTAPEPHIPPTHLAYLSIQNAPETVYTSQMIRILEIKRILQCVAKDTLPHRSPERDELITLANINRLLYSNKNKK